MSQDNSDGALLQSSDSSDEQITKSFQTADSVTLLKFNVSGHRFITTADTLLQYPNTRLGRLASAAVVSEETFYDADVDIFQEVLRYYRSGELHIPKSVCYQAFCSQLEFWDLMESEISPCCRVDSDEALEKQFLWFERRVDYQNSLQHHIWNFLTDPIGPNTRCKPLSVLWTFIYMSVCILQSVGLGVLTSPQYIKQETNASMDIDDAFDNPCLTLQLMQTLYKMWLTRLLRILSGFFVMEITIRFLFCPDKRWFFKSVNSIDLLIGLLDLASLILSVLISHLDMNQQKDEECVTYLGFTFAFFAVVSLRAFRIVSHASVYSGVQVLLLALYNSWKEVMLLVFGVGVSCLMLGPIVYYADVRSEGKGIPNIPTAYWFIVVTMSTVGYGSITVRTLAGHLVASAVIIFGLMVTALPIAIIGGNFTELHAYSNKRRKPYNQ